MDKRSKQRIIPFQVMQQEMRRWRRNPRIGTVLLIEILCVWDLVEPARRYAASAGLSVSNWFFPFLFVNYLNTTILYIGLVLLFCNAPFIDEHHMYVLLRSGRKRWFLGEMLYIVCASALFFLLQYVLSLVEFIPYLGFSADWGSVIRFSADSPGLTGIAGIEPSVIKRFAPIQALLLCYGLQVGTAVFLGFLIFYVNLYKSRGFGAAAALGVVFLSGIISWLSPEEAGNLCYLSPLSWGSLEVFCMEPGGIRIGYAAALLLGGTAVLAALIMRRSKTYGIEALEEI